MRLRTILMTLILGASTTAAVAQPAQVHSRHTPSYRGADAHWVPLINSVGNSKSAQKIIIPREVGRFDKIRLVVDDGHMYVVRVTIQYGNGTNDKVILNRQLRAGEILDVDMPGKHRAIKAVTVVGRLAKARSTGRYSVLALQREPTRLYTWRDHWPYSR